MSIFEENGKNGKKKTSMLYSFMHDFQTCKINFYAEYLVSGNLSRSCLDGLIPNYCLVGVVAKD